MMSARAQDNPVAAMVSLLGAAIAQNAVFFVGMTSARPQDNPVAVMMSLLEQLLPKMLCFSWE
jgi:hypothetical protein